MFSVMVSVNKRPITQLKCLEIKRRLRSRQETVFLFTIFLLKMAQLTTAVEDEEVVRHFQEVLAPYVIETQLTAGIESNISPTSNTKCRGRRTFGEKFQSGEEFIEEFTYMLESGLQGMTKKQVVNDRYLTRGKQIFYRE